MSQSVVLLCIFPHYRCCPTVKHPLTVPSSGCCKQWQAWAHQHLVHRCDTWYSEVIWQCLLGNSRWHCIIISLLLGLCVQFLAIWVAGRVHLLPHTPWISSWLDFASASTCPTLHSLSNIFAPNLDNPVTWLLSAPKENPNGPNVRFPSLGK